MSKRLSPKGCSKFHVQKLIVVSPFHPIYLLGKNKPHSYSCCCGLKNKGNDRLWTYQHKWIRKILLDFIEYFLALLAPLWLSSLL